MTTRSHQAAHNAGLALRRLLSWAFAQERKQKKHCVVCDMTAVVTTSSSSSHSEGKGTDPQSASDSASSPTEMHASSRFVQSRVGRTNQRYDGTTRLLACAVVLRPATRKRPAPPHSLDTSDPAEKDDQEVLVITSSKHPNEWIIPKGGWENDESVEECALREVEEEAGVSIRCC